MAQRKLPRATEMAAKAEGFGIDHLLDYVAQAIESAAGQGKREIVNPLRGAEIAHRPRTPVTGEHQARVFIALEHAGYRLKVEPNGQNVVVSW